MPEKPDKSTLLVCRQSPYGGQLSRSALDIALASSVFEQKLSVLFMDDGVWQLLPDQRSLQIDQKSIEKTLASFEMYDIDALYAEEHSIRSRGLSEDQIVKGLELVDEEAMSTFFQTFDTIISC